MRPDAYFAWFFLSQLGHIPFSVQSPAPFRSHLSGCQGCTLPGCRSILIGSLPIWFSLKRLCLHKSNFVYPSFFFELWGAQFSSAPKHHIVGYIYICIQVYNMNLSISHRIRLNIPIRIASKYPISSDSLTFRHRKSQRMTIWRTLWRQLGAMFFGIHSWKRQEDTELCWLAMVGL
jgi:hypothetical protein